MTAKLTRKFDGKVYRSYSLFLLAVDARDRADLLRRRGYLARVVLTTGGTRYPMYELFVREK